MIYAETAKEVEAKRKAFLRKWRLRCRPVADSLEEAGEKLFTFLRFPSDQWKSIRTTNAIERLRQERIEAAHQNSIHAALRGYCFHAVLGVVGQRAVSPLRKVDRWRTLNVAPADEFLIWSSFQPITSLAGDALAIDNRHQLPDATERKDGPRLR